MTTNAERRPGTGAAHQLADETTASVERSRRRWRLDRQGHHRSVVRAFDAWAVGYYGPDAARDAGIRYGTTESACPCCCHAPPSDSGDYWRDMGFNLGVPERRAAGLALRGVA